MLLLFACTQIEELVEEMQEEEELIEALFKTVKSERNSSTMQSTTATGRGSDSGGAGGGGRRFSAIAAQVHDVEAQAEQAINRAESTVERAAAQKAAGGPSKAALFVRSLAALAGAVTHNTGVWTILDQYVGQSRWQNCSTQNGGECKPKKTTETFSLHTERLCVSLYILLTLC